MTVLYRVNAPLEPETLADLFARSGIRRPTGDLERLRCMIAHANLTVTARDGARLVGIARALTDFSYCCYLSDLAVDCDYQHQGIGGALVSRVRAEAGEEAALILLSAPEAMAYYPKIGFKAAGNAWIIKRAR